MTPIVPKNPKSLLPQGSQAADLTSAEVSGLTGVPVDVVEALKAGNPTWKADAYMRQMTIAYGEAGLVMKAAVIDARNRIWASHRFPSNATHIAGFNGIRG